MAARVGFAVCVPIFLPVPPIIIFVSTIIDRFKIRFEFGADAVDKSVAIIGTTPVEFVTLLDEAHCGDLFINDDDNNSISEICFASTDDTVDDTVEIRFEIVINVAAIDALAADAVDGSDAIICPKSVEFVPKTDEANCDDGFINSISENRFASGGRHCRCCSLDE